MKYYSVLRPVSMGTFPERDKVKQIVNFDDRQFVEEINHEAWGYIEYEEEIDPILAKSYDLVSEKSPIWYGVQSVFYNSGKTKARIIDTIRAANKPDSRFSELETCSIYIDWFATKEEADQAVEDTLSAHGNFYV